MLYGDVIIDISLEKLDKTFQYEIPEHLRETVQIGSRVVIPFGNGKRRITGYVVDMSTEPKIDAGRIKPILGVSKDSIAVDCAGCLDPPQLWMHHEPGIKDGHPHQEKRGRQGKKDGHLSSDAGAGAGRTLYLACQKKA
jgi:primosomal protein N' (replication factor Y)